MSSLNRIAKNRSFIVCKDNIKEYLKEKLSSSLLRRLLLSKAKAQTKILKQTFFNKWRKSVTDSRISEIELKSAVVNAFRILEKKRENLLRNFFNFWRRQIPRGRAILDVNKGVGILGNFCRRMCFRDPLNAIGEVAEEESKRNSVEMMVSFRRRNYKSILSQFFNRWKNQCNAQSSKEDKDYIISNLLSVLTKKIERRILYKRFNRWRLRPKLDVKNELGKYRMFERLMTDLYNRKTLNDKAKLLNVLKSLSNNSAKFSAGGEFIKKYNLKDNRVLKYYFVKWRKRTQEMGIKDLKLKLFAYLFNARETREKKLNLGKYFTRWRLFTGEGKNYDNLTKLKQVNKGADFLRNLHHRSPDSKRP